MDLVERYNSELKGCRFYASDGITYTFGDIINNDKAIIRWGESSLIDSHNINEIIDYVDRGSWKIDKSDIRKKKLKKLMNK